MDSMSSKVRIISGKSPADPIAKEMFCMKDPLEISSGLDVHKEKIVACILTGPLDKPIHSEIREFSLLSPDMNALRDWIVSQNCHHVAMESTGIYWMPVYEKLEDAFSGDITLLVVNVSHMKNVTGKNRYAGFRVDFHHAQCRDSERQLHSRKKGSGNSVI